MATAPRVDRESVFAWSNYRGRMRYKVGCAAFLVLLLSLTALLWWWLGSLPGYTGAGPMVTSRRLLVDRLLPGLMVVTGLAGFVTAALLSDMADEDKSWFTRTVLVIALGAAAMLFLGTVFVAFEPGRDDKIVITVDRKGFSHSHHSIKADQPRVSVYNDTTDS